MMYSLIMDDVKPETRHGAVYGEHYVFLGYIAGVQMAIASVLGGSAAIVSSDYLGTPIDQIPVLNGISGSQDIDIRGYLTTAGGT